MEYFQECLVGFQEAEESYALHITFLQYVPYYKPPTAPDEGSSSSNHSNNEKPKKGLGELTSEIPRPETRLNASLHHTAKLFCFLLPFTHNLMHDYASALEPLSESTDLLNQRLIALLRLRSVGVGLGKPNCRTETPLSKLQVSLAVPEIHPCVRPPLSPDIHPRLSGWEGPELKLSS